MAAWQIVGHRRPMEILRRMIKGGRFPHALVFEGPDGIGKKRVALWALKALICKIQPGEGCGDCEDCHSIERLLHPDLHILEPIGDSIRVEQVREAEALLRLKPLRARTRALIVEDAHKMTPEASNSLLKTLEEPPPNTVIFLITPLADGLLPTVLSRCQRIRFFPLKPEEVLQVIKGLGVQLPDDSLLQEGSPGKVLKALTEDFSPLLERARVGGIKGVIEVAEQIGSNRERALAFLRFLLQRQGRNHPDLFWKLLDIYRSLEDYANPRLCLEAALLQISFPRR